MEIKYELDKNESIYDIGPGQYADAIFKSLGVTIYQSLKHGKESGE